MSKALKAFMKDNFDFSTFKKCGLYPKELKHNDYEGQAKIICHRLGLKNIYDYGKHEIRCHITYADPEDKIGMASYRPPVEVDCNGKLTEKPFVEVFFKNQLHI